MQADYEAFAANVTERLRKIHLRDDCGMMCVRFYCCEHSLRLPKEVALAFINNIVDVDYRHVNVIQIHRADNLRFDHDDQDVILTKLYGRRTKLISRLFIGFVRLACKLEKYRVVFLSDYGYFNCHASSFSWGPDHVVTFTQAYSLPAKMILPPNVGLIAAHVICRGYANGDKALREYEDSAKQYVYNVFQYYKNYVRRGHVLRVEKVLTLDMSRLRQTMSEAFATY